MTNILELINTLSHDELVALTQKLSYDVAFGVKTRAIAEITYKTIRNKYIVMLDVANMHALNHTYKQMSIVDSMIRGFITDMRAQDIYRHGGDELVFILDNRDDIDRFIARMIESLDSHNLYGTIAVYNAIDTTLTESIKRLDTEINTWKEFLEQNGLKANRDEPYTKLESDVLYCL